MNWWSANRYCQALRAQGKVEHGTLVSLEELGCTIDGCADGALRKALNAAYSCAEGEDCPSFNGYVWTSTPDNESENSCAVYYVYLNNGDVGADVRDDYTTDALCE